MGNAAPQASATQQNQIPRDILQDNLPNFIVQDQLGNGKFMKSFRCKVDGMPVVVKVYIKRDPDEDLSIPQEQIRELAAKLKPTEHPNVLPYHIPIEFQRTNTMDRRARLSPAPAVFLVRQAFLTSLYDRLSTRPFLAISEKKWLVYQLFRAVEQLHTVGLWHGDLKTENVMVTSWHWVTLVDMAPFKPIKLDHDNTAGVNYYFHTDEKRRQRCYLAPERFETMSDRSQSRTKGRARSEIEGSSRTSSMASDELEDFRALAQSRLDVGILYGEDQKQLQAMDIFSLGCVIAEVFLDGEAPLDLPGLVEYRKANAEASLPKLNKPGNKLELCDKKVCRLVQHMTRRNPSERKSALEYRERMEDPGTQLFPACFSSFLYDFMRNLHIDARTPDERILTICRNYGKVVQELANLSDPAGEAFFRHYLLLAEGKSIEEKTPAPPGPWWKEEERQGQDAAAEEYLYDETRRIIAEVTSMDISDLDMMSSGHGGISSGTATMANPTRRRLTSGGSTNNQPSSEGANLLIILVQVVCSSMRHVRFPSTKLLSLVLLVRLSQHLDDEAKLQRLVPYVVTMLQDPFAPVKASAVRALRSILSMVCSFPPSEAKLFPKYLFPAFTRLLSDSEELVRVAFAESIASFAETSLRFLDKAHAMNQQRSSESELKDTEGRHGKSPVFIRGSIDRELLDLHTQVSKFVMPLVASVDTSFSVAMGGVGGGSSGVLAKRALLKDITRLCAFYGEEKTLSSLLPQLITFLNDKDWELRSAFCEHIPGVCAYVGEVATAEFILPCVENALTDAHELVAGQALHCLHSLIRMGLLSRELMLEKVAAAAPLLFHPSGWVRMGAISLCGSVGHILEKEDAYVFLLPFIRPYLRYDLMGGEVNATTIAAALQPPVSREAYQRALAQASKKMSHVDSSQDSSSEYDSESEELSGTSSSTFETSNRSTRDSSMQSSAESEESFVSGVSSGEKMVLASDPDPQHSRILSDPTFDKVLPKPAIPNAQSMLTLSKMNQDSSERTARRVHSETGMVTSPRGEIPKRFPSAPHTRVRYKAGERQKLALLRDYVKMVTEKRVNRQRAQVGTPKLGEAQSLSSSGLKASVPESCISNSRDDDPILRHMINLSQGLAQSISIPDQRYTTLQPVPPQKTMDKLDRLDREAPGEILKCLKEGFGVSSRIRGTSRLGNQQAHLGHARAENEASQNSGLGKMVTQDAADSSVLLCRLKALDLPPLPPDFGKLRQRNGQPYSLHSEHFVANDDAQSQREGLPNTSGSAGVSPPKIIPMVSSLTEHSGAVNRLCIAQDQTFFVSASSDGTAKIWDLRDMDVTQVRSRVTHQGPGGEILDTCMIDNTHSLALATSQGYVQVSRVDLLSSSASKSPNQYHRNPQQRLNEYPRFTADGVSVIYEANQDEGPVLSVLHFNGDTFSLLVFATQQGYLHGWDLRNKYEVWKLQIRPEFGFLTAMALGTDKNWIITGTNRGYILIWDLRFQILTKVWRHSSQGPIFRLATCARLPFENYTSGPLPRVFIAAGNNEAASWDIFSGGPCQQCFRVLPPNKCPADDITDTTLPKLEEIDIPTHPNAVLSLPNDFNSEPVQPASSIRTLIGRMGRNISHEKENTSHLITGGSDGFIRYWDYTQVAKCFCISGYEQGQPRSRFQKYVSEINEKNQLFVCQDYSPPSADKVPAHFLPITEQRGIIRPTNQHSDAVLDLKSVDLPLKMIISSGRDGVVKLWKK